MSKVPLTFRNWWDELSLLRKEERGDSFSAIVDVQQFDPNEMIVKVNGDDRSVVVECNHEEKEDEHGFICRSFSRRFLVPEAYDIQRVASSLSSDGILTISAPKLEGK